MSAICPNGHTSDSDDYCDTCGSPIDPAAQTGSAEGVGGPAAGVGGPAAGRAGAAPTGTGGAAGPAAASSGAAAPRSGSSLDLDPPGAAAGGVTGHGAASDAAAQPAGPATLECPNCHTENADGALFCEACGYDFTTGAMPRDPSVPAEGDGEGDREGDDARHGTGDGDGEMAAPSSARSDPTAPGGDAGALGTGSAAGSGRFDWLAEVWIDPDWYKTQEAEDPCPSPGLPLIVPLRARSVLLGRVSTSRNTRPEIDLSSDPGVSRRHAQLTTDGSRWFVEDLGSSNGTYVAPAAGPLPDKAIPVGPRMELDDDDRLYVGAWTRVVVREATPDEVEAYG